MKFVFFIKVSGSAALKEPLTKLGNLKKAKLNLEAAVELSPTSATIIDHLGDIYWVIGRKKEAMYQWERALNYNPTKKEKNYILEKLDGKFVYQYHDIGVQS